MSITVSFTSDSKRENSTKQLTMAATHDCTFKNGCSMLNPTLLLELNTATFPTYTAFKIEDRYYRITDIRSVRNNLFEIDGIIDVLATYKSEILASTQYVCYSSHNSNTWLPDTRIPLVKATDTNRNTVSMAGLFNPNGFYVMTAVGLDGCCAYAVDKSTLDHILASIQDWQDDAIQAIDAIISTTRGVDLDPYTFPAPTDDFQGLCDGLGKTIQSGFVALTGTMANAQKALADSLATMGEASVSTGLVGNAYAQAPSCIRSCIWVPFFATPFVDTGKDLYLGNLPCKYNGSIIRPFTLKGSAHTGSTSINIPWHYSDWRRGICEDVYLYLPMVGMIQLSATSLTNVSSLTIKWSATATDGVVCYEIIADGNVIGTYSGQCSANYPIGINQQASAGEIVQSILTGAQATVSAGMQTAQASASLNPVSSTLGVATGAVNTVFTGVQSGYDVINTMNTSHVSCIGGIGGGAGSGLDLDIQCYTVCHETVMTPNDMKDTMGLPTMLPYPLATLTGYCECANAHIDIAATRTESAAVDSYLNTGIFIE